MSDLREALNKAMDGKEVDNVHDEDDSVVERPEPEEIEANADEGMFGEGIEDNAEEEELSDRLNDEKNAEENPEAPKGDDQPEAKQGDTADKSKDKPPVGWTPENREHWAKLPAGLKSQISKREQEVNQVLQQSSSARKFAQDFSKTIQPYQAMMVAEGASNPVEAVGELLKTAATLSMGSKVQKAQRVAQLVRHYGVDIGALDDVLAGSMPNPQAPQQNDIAAEVERLVAQRLAPYEQQQNQQRQQQHQQVQQRAAKSLQEVSQREFFNDVRLDMADILEVASRRGQRLTAEDAYNRAVQLNPEIMRVVSQRKNQGLEQKRKAASSVRGTRGGVSDSAGDQSLRDALEANWSGR